MTSDRAPLSTPSPEDAPVRALVDRILDTVVGTMPSRTEVMLQNTIARKLERALIACEREVKLGDAGRIDFLCKEGDAIVGIEVKIDGSLSELVRQVDRYARSERLAAIVVATTLHRLSALPALIAGRRIYIAFVGNLDPR